MVYEQVIHKHRAQSREQSRKDACRRRARKARGIARVVKIALSCALATAIWQDRGLYPQSHDRMKQTVAMAQDWLDESEDGMLYRTSLANFKGGAGQNGYDPVTRALLSLH